MAEAGIVTLTSDFGTQDPYVAIIKGALLKARSVLNVIDITHDLRKHDIEQAAYAMKLAIPHFPQESVHIAMLDLNAEHNKTILMARWHNQWILTTDNGIVSIIDNTINEIYALPAPDTTMKSFLAIEWLVPSALKLLQQEHPSSWASLAHQYREWLVMSASTSQNAIRANVLYVDSFENVVLNIKEVDFQKARQNRRFRLSLPKDTIAGELSKGYEDVPEGEVLLLFNNGGYLEIAVNKGNASGLFNLKLRDSVIIEFF